MPGHKPRMPLEVPPHSSRARLGRNLRAHTPAFPPPTLSGPSPVPSRPPPNFLHLPPVFTSPPSSRHSRAAQTALRMAQIDGWPSHFVTRAEWHRFARRARPRGARTSLGRGPSPTAGASLTPACAPLRAGGGPHFFACAPLPATGAPHISPGRQSTPTAARAPKPLRRTLNRVACTHPCHHALSARRTRSPGTDARRRHTR